MLNTDASGLNELAKSYQTIYPIAARCGVFAKTDIQPLINEGASHEDLAVSIFQAVVNQTISGLACGRVIRGKWLSWGASVLPVGTSPAFYRNSGSGGGSGDLSRGFSVLRSGGSGADVGKISRCGSGYADSEDQ